MYYPVFLDLSGKKVLVIGGGRVAARKISALLKCKAEVHVVSDKVHPQIRNFKKRMKIRLLKRRFQVDDLTGKELIVCATDDARLNHTVGSECQKRKIWVNVADRPSLCSFIVPSVIRRGDVHFAVSTGGASPALSKFLRKKLEQAFGSEVGTLARFLKKFRGKILKLPPKEKKAILARLVNDKTLSKLRRGIRLSLTNS